VKKLLIFTDGGSRGNPGIAGGGYYAENENGDFIAEKDFFLGKKTNNESEYLAFLKSAQWLGDFLKKNKVQEVIFHLDSKLVVEQVNRRWKIKESRLQELAKQCWLALEQVKIKTKIIHVRRELNSKADALANVAMDKGC